jgi:hypothetical protein
MQYFETEQTKANTIQQTITQTDKEIDTMVYKLYELTDEEIKIVESQLKYKFSYLSMLFRRNWK